MKDDYSITSANELKEQVNIVDVVGRVVPLKRKGKNFWGCCPFHNEKTPSFSVAEDKQFYYCFGCHAKGDVLEFVQKYYNLDFGEAMQKIADEYGLTIKKMTKGPDRQKYYDINKLAAKFFYDNFTKSKNPGYTYMKNRGIEDGILKKFGIGFADDKWDSLYEHLKSLDVDSKDMVELGLVSQKGDKYYDRFRNRVMFPIINTAGKVIGFGGRAIGDDNPKYLNSPESKIFQKKNNLYGLNLAKKDISHDDGIILVEGYMDVIGLYQGGVKNVSASLGTALTDNQAKLIKRYTDKVTLSYDSDAAGRNAALRGIDILLDAGCKVNVVHVTDGKDPDEFIRAKGKEAYLDLVSHATPAIEYKFNSVKGNLDLSNYEDKVEYTKRTVAILKQLNPIDREVYIPKLAQIVGVSEGAIRMELGEKLGNDNLPKQTQTTDDNTVGTTINNYEKNILKVIFTRPDLLKTVLECDGIIASEFPKKILEIAKKQYDEKENFDFESVAENLDPEESILLSEIIKFVKLGGNEKEILEETLNKWRREQIQKEEKEILSLISMADENIKDDEIKKLTDRLNQLDIEKRKYN